ncbi:uncharacterized protein ACBR49_012011 [Aulostomus maculatus]
MFVDVMKGLLQLDPSERMTPCQAQEHPFITTSHLTGFHSSSSYAKSCFKIMSIAKIRTQPAPQQSPPGLPSRYVRTFVLLLLREAVWTTFPTRVNRRVASKRRRGSAVLVPIHSGLQMLEISTADFISWLLPLLRGESRE